MKKNLNKKIFIILSFGILVVFVGLVVFLKHCLTYEILEDALYKFTGLKVEFIEPKSTFDYKFNVVSNVKKINFYNANKTNLYLTVHDADIKFKPFAFLLKKINFQKFNANDILVYAKKENNGNIDIIESLNKENIEILLKQKYQISNLNSQIKNIEIFYEDSYFSKSNTHFKANNTNVSISKKNKKIEVIQNGLITNFIANKKTISDYDIDITIPYYSKNKLSQHRFDVKVNNFNLLPFVDLAQKYISKNINGLSGLIDFKLTTNDNNHNFKLLIKNPSLILKDGRIISPYKKGVNINSEIAIRNDDIEILSGDIFADKLNIFTKGKVQKIFSKKPDVDLNVSIKNSQINNLLYFIPDNAIFYRPKGIPTLKESNFYGLANGDINLKLFPLDITGNLKVQNVHIPGYPKPFRQNDINAAFMKDKVRVYTRVYTPQNEYVTVDGVSNLDDSLYGKYSVNSTKKIDLEYARLYLVPVQQIIGFNIGPVPIMQMSGNGNINIRTQGTLTDAQIFGEFNANNATVRMDGLDAKLTNGKCKLVFDNRLLHFKDFRGKLDGADFAMQGVGNTKGDVELNIDLLNANSKNILKIFNNSIIGQPYSSLTKNLSVKNGLINAKVNLKGTIKDYESTDLFKVLQPSGRLEIKNNDILFDNFVLKKLNGVLDFGLNQKATLSFYVNDSKFNAEFSSKTPLNKISSGSNFDFNSVVSSNKISSKDLINEIIKTSYFKEINLSENIKNLNFFTKMYVTSSGSLSINNLDFSKIKNNGYIIGLNSQDSNVKFNSGIIKILKDKLYFENFDIDVFDGNVKIKGLINNFLSKAPIGDLVINLKNINLDNFSGLISKIKFENSNLQNGQIYFKNQDIKFNSININHQAMPIFLNAHFKNIYTTKNIVSNFSTILNEKTADNIVNPFLLYPVKIKGEIPIKGNFKGNVQNYSIDFDATLPKDSDFSYSGANLGEVNHKRKIIGKIDVNDNVANLNNIKLIKYISNQNNKVNPITVLKLNGKLVQKGKELYFDDFRVLTNVPMSVRMLNLVFKKSILKKGFFECDITLDGNSKTPFVNGIFNLNDLDIPLYDTQISKINTNLNTKFINAQIIANNKQSDVKINLRALNSLKPPYIVDNLDIVSNYINIDDILSSIIPSALKTDISAKPELQIKPQDVIIKNGNFNFGEVKHENILVQGVKGNFAYKDNLFDLKNIILSIANGKIIANGKYSLKTTKLDVSAKMENCDSNILASNFLKLNGHIYGKANGLINLSAKDLNTPSGIKTIKSDITFSVINGKMPKLGSLEYLLRAGNFFKNGFTGLSLNNLIEVLTPYKTGEFDYIEGKLSLNQANVENLEIQSQGKNLSLYIMGNYNILENFADIKLYGKISQNISNALGVVGNASLSQIINNAFDKDKTEVKEEFLKIPLVENEDLTPRYFSALVYGDINKERYIKRFNWE